MLTGHQSPVTSVSFSLDGHHLASAAADNTIRLWNCTTGACLAILVPGAEGWAALTPDGRYKMGGVLNGEVWHAINLCRFELGELDPYLPASLRLPDDYRFLNLAPKPALVASEPALVATVQPEPQLTHPPIRRGARLMLFTAALLASAALLWMLRSLLLSDR